MWVLLTRRRTWLLLAVAIPVVRAVILRAGSAARRRDSHGMLTATLARADSVLTRLDRRPARDGRADRAERSRRRSHRTHGAKGGWL